MGASQTEVRALLTENIVHDLIARIGFQVGQDKRGSLGKGCTNAEQYLFDNMRGYLDDHTFGYTPAEFQIRLG